MNSYITMWSMGCIEKSFCPAEAVGSENKYTSVGEEGDNYQSKSLTCSYFTESQFDANKPATFCGEIGM